jgi:hypothetical protein
MQHIFAALLALVLMPLLQPISRCALEHTRAIQVEAFIREDGLWDLDAHITDIKVHDGASTDAQSHKPFQLDRCHALRTDAAAGAKYYPRWAIKSASGSKSS